MISLETESCLVLPDIHLRWKLAESIIAHRQGEVRNVAALGDYFHQFGDTPGHNSECAEWLKRRLELGDILIMGNHDAAHLAELAHAKLRECPGYSPDKDRAVRSKLTGYGRRFHLGAYVNGWLLSHAGVNPQYGFGQSREHLYEYISAAESALHDGAWHPLFHDGYRMNDDPTPPGGILWQDWDHEHRRLPGIPQIVGHTPAAMPRYGATSEDGRVDVCLDTDSRHYGIIRSDGSMEVYGSKRHNLIAVTPRRGLAHG